VNVEKSPRREWLMIIALLAIVVTIVVRWWTSQ
jgi:hypothetical protein